MSSLRTYLRHALRAFSQRFPQFRRFHGRLGLGRWLSAGGAREQIRVDGDIVIELDLSSAWFRGLYYTLDPAGAEETLLLRRLLTPDGVCVDVGAHIGYFALVAAKYGRHVQAFEPSPVTFAYLQRNLALNPRLAGRVSAHCLGLSDRPGTLPLYRPAQEPGAASLRPPSYADLAVETIQLDTLDHVLDGGSPAFIKIDVEGAELDVLTGAQTTLARCRPLVLLELNARAQRDFGRTCQDVVHFFDPLDYRGFLVEAQPTQRGRVAVSPLNAAAFGPDEIRNALFIPVERVDSVLAQIPS